MVTKIKTLLAIILYSVSGVSAAGDDSYPNLGSIRLKLDIVGKCSVKHPYKLLVARAEEVGSIEERRALMQPLSQKGDANLEGRRLYVDYKLSIVGKRSRNVLVKRYVDAKDDRALYRFTVNCKEKLLPLIAAEKSVGSGVGRAQQRINKIETFPEKDK